MIKNIPIDELIPNEYEHKRKSKKQKEALDLSLKRFGFLGTNIVVDKSNRIITGMHLYKAAVTQGFTEVPCEVVDMDEDTAEKYSLMDNLTGGVATWKKKELKSEAKRYASTLAEFGVGAEFAEESEAIKKRLAEESESDEPKEAKKVKKPKPMHQCECPSCGETVTYRL